MHLYLNNHYCLDTRCYYTTGVTSENEHEADEKLQADGGLNEKKVSKCPLCHQDSLVFLPKN